MSRQQLGVGKLGTFPPSSPHPALRAKEERPSPLSMTCMLSDRVTHTPLGAGEPL